MFLYLFSKIRFFIKVKNLLFHFILILFLGSCYSKEIKLRIEPEPKNYAWWLRIYFEPAHKTIREIPLNKIDPSWKVASELTLKAFLSHHLISKEFKSQYQASKFGFTIQGDFNHDAREDLGIVGVYISEDGGGRFLLVLSKTESGGWEKYYLKKWEGKRGLIYFDKTKKNNFEIWFCYHCDTFEILKWNDKLRKFEINHPEWGRRNLSK